MAILPLFLPLTNFGPQGHKIPAEIQPRISSDECAIYRATHDSSKQNKVPLWIASTSARMRPERDFWENCGRLVLSQGAKVLSGSAQGIYPRSVLRVVNSIVVAVPLYSISDLYANSL